MSELDWTTIPEIKRRLTKLEEAAKSDDKDDQELANWFLMERGTTITLELEVTDPRLAQLVIGSIYAGPTLIPGFDIITIERDSLVNIKNNAKKRK